MPIDSTKVKDRRQVTYASLQEILADAERLCQGKVKSLGNWSPGQIFWHLAKAFNDSIDGSDLKVSWFIRLLRPVIKKKVLSGPISPGVKLDANAEQVLWPGPTSTENGLAALRTAIGRLQSESKRGSKPRIWTHDQR